jgi:hypothetical protein
MAVGAPELPVCELQPRRLRLRRAECRRDVVRGRPPRPFEPALQSSKDSTLTHGDGMGVSRQGDQASQRSCQRGVRVRFRCPLPSAFMT